MLNFFDKIISNKNKSTSHIILNFQSQWVIRMGWTWLIFKNSKSVGINRNECFLNSKVFPVDIRFSNAFLIVKKLIVKNQYMLKLLVA